MKTASWQRGFTVSEEMAVVLIRVLIVMPTIFIGTFGVMVVIVIREIITSASALVAAKIINRPDEARLIAAKRDIANLMQVLNLYRRDNHCYPVTEQGLQALAIQPASAPFPPNWKTGGYIECLPKDHWGNPYQYLNPGGSGEIDIFSLGADDVPGGEGNDADFRLLVSSSASNS